MRASSRPAATGASLGQFLAEGEDIVEEALAAGILPVETLIAADRPPDEGLVARLARGGPVLSVRDSLLAEVGGLGHPARVIALYEIASLPREYPVPGTGYSPLAVYLHRVIDPGQRRHGRAGVRRARAGAARALAGLLRPARRARACARRWAPSSACPIETGAELPEDGLRVALVAGAATPLWEVDLTGPAVLVVGAERHGLPAEVVEACDVVCAIPQAAGAESLNAAQAATLALYEAVRQRAQGASPNGG